VVNREQLQDTEAHLTATTARETCSQLNSLCWPIPCAGTEKAHEPRAARGLEGGWQKATLTQRKALSMGRLREGRSVQILRLLKQTWLEWYESRAFEVGAALAFYAIFSVAPVMVLAFTAASLVLGGEAAQGRLTQEIESTVGHTVAVAIQATAQYTYQSGSSIPATVLSIVFFGFGATGLFSQLQSALNEIWEVEPKPGRGLRGSLHDRFGSFLAVLGISALLLADLLVTAVLSSLSQILPTSPTREGFPLWWAVTFVISWAFLTLAIALVYRILPDAKIAWRDVWVGAGSSGLLFLLGNHLIGWYLAAAGITSVYGAAGSIVIVLLWVYYSSQVGLFGAEFTRVYAKHRGAPLEPKKNAVRVNRRGPA